MIPSPAGEIFAVFSPGKSETAEASGVDESRKPLVVLCHGLMMSCEQNPIMGVSKIFNDAGYDTLRFDFRGSGKSSGLITEMTPLTEVDDLLSVISFVRAKGRRVVLCGHSLGGLVSLITASKLADSAAAVAASVDSNLGAHPTEDKGALSVEEKSVKAVSDLNGQIAVDSDSPNVVDALVLLAPAVNIETDSRNGRVADVHFDPVNIPDEVEVWGSKLSKQYFVTAQNLNTFEVISHYKGPVCIMMGDRDRIVELNLSGRILEALPQAELHTLEHGDHLFSRGVRLRAGVIAVDFCNRLGYLQYSKNNAMDSMPA